MVTFANLGVRPSTKFEVRRPSRSEDTAHLVCQLSIYNSFPVIRTTIAKNRHFYVHRPSFFCLPCGRRCGNHAKRCMNKKTIQCFPHSIYPPILNSFPVIRTASAKKSPFSRTAARLPSLKFVGLRVQKIRRI